MGRKKDLELIRLENKIKVLTADLSILKIDFVNFVEASKADWKYLREYCNKRIEGN